MTVAGRDGERLVTDEIRHKAVDRFRTDPLLEDLLPIEYRPMVADSLLAAVAPDIAADVERRVLDRCATELRRTHRSIHAVLGPTDERGRERKNRCITDGQTWPCVDEQTAAEWSSSGRTPVAAEAMTAVAPDIAAGADQRWATELTAQAERYASVGTEVADAMAEALRTAVRIMEETEQG